VTADADQQERSPDLRVFLARCRIAEMLQFGGVGVYRELGKLDRSEVEDIAVEALGVFAVLDDRPGSACRWWRQYAETRKAPL
jgi:hypothetical protein